MVHRIIFVGIVLLCSVSYSNAWVNDEQPVVKIDFKHRLKKGFYRLKALSHKSQIGVVGPILVSSSDEYKNYENDYDRREVLGKGSFATVYKGISRETGESVAIKVLNKSSMDELIIESIKQEIHILQMLPDHPNICKFFDVFEEEETISIILEYCGSKNLAFVTYEGIENNTEISEEQASKYMKQALEGLSALHKKGIYMIDVKLTNMIVNERGVLKLVDFGISGTVEYPNYSFQGADGYYGREMMLSIPYHSSLFDSWGIGVSTYKLLYRFYPFGANRQNSYLFKHKLRYLIYSFPPESPPSEELVSFLSHIFVEEKFRYSVDQLLQHEWITKHNE